MYRPISDDVRGFSFVEVLVAIVLFSFLVVGVLLMTSMNIKSNAYTQHHTKAVQLAESGLEILRRVDYNNELPNYDGANALSFSDYGQIPNYPDFRRRLQVVWGSQISTLQVTVNWRSLNRDSPPLVISTLRVSP
ncbi:MAG: prepilin-type N-terminal cleavage/methylation domain-containing protein [Candidatus Aminicenantes bacterium]|nr:prepilin-type N-terminal cleavage/methylation domain-containing protein [Candidatus Aminicenantes bacterium]